MEEAINKVIADLYEQERQRLDAIRRHQEALELKRREEEIKAIAYDKLRIAELEKALHNGYRRDAYYLIFNPYEYYSAEDTDQNNIINKTLRSYYYNNENFRIEIKYNYSLQRQIDEAVRNGYWNTLKSYRNEIFQYCPANLKPYAERLFAQF
jgi:hypothetical protein